MTIERLAHACLFSTDLDRTEKFYCGMLGLKLKFPFMAREKRIGFYMEVGEMQFIEVFLRDTPLKNQEPYIGHICLETDDIKGLTTKLHANGIKTTTPEPVMGSDDSWQIWCKDPDGTDIEFHQYTPASSQLTGKTCIAHWLL
ncbi:MAG: VOC family protein [Verrucomicrobiales bacterium]|jgi:catechol 2,3-dioxygenase-like lactoylglutathione lyase family enzyme|nr:VOC family protein [Verrucomicrobiales bacterium]